MVNSKLTVEQLRHICLRFMSCSTYVFNSYHRSFVKELLLFVFSWQNLFSWMNEYWINKLNNYSKRLFIKYLFIPLNQSGCWIAYWLKHQLCQNKTLNFFWLCSISKKWIRSCSLRSVLLRQCFCFIDFNPIFPEFPIFLCRILSLGGLLYYQIQGLFLV
jgi:hypothetical protein